MFQAYDPSYVSHAHPWASGPSIVLSRNVAGVQFTNPTQTTWSIIPEASLDLDFALTGVSSATGELLVAGWSKTSKWAFEMAIKAPGETIGLVGVPAVWKEDQGWEVKLNGRAVTSGVGKEIDAIGDGYAVYWLDRHVMIERLGGGNSAISVSMWD